MSMLLEVRFHRRAERRPVLAELKALKIVFGIGILVDLSVARMPGGIVGPGDQLVPIPTLLHLALTCCVAMPQLCS